MCCHFLIQAKDSDAYDPRTATAAATITVIDINDNPPMFEQSVYMVLISENQPPNSVVSMWLQYYISSSIPKNVP